MKKVPAKAWCFVKRNRTYFLSALIPAAILFLSYAVFGVFPFGKRSVLSLDLNAQYVYYFDYIYDVLAGKESLFYCWSRNLSGEFMGIIGYYLASPFNFLVWIFPRTMITEGLLAMMLAKAAASGFTAALFLKKHRGYSDFTSLIFALMYSLCGFFVVQTMNPMWLDGLLGLPLVVMGVERVCDKRRFLLYILAQLYVFVTNFYIGYMIGIFSALYFAYYLASGKSENKGIRQYLGAAGLYGLSSVCAILMSCVMILPVYKSLSNGKFAFTEPDYTPAENFNIADSFIKLFPTTYDTVRMEGLPILYFGTLALIFAVIYFTVKKIPVRNRIAGAVFVGALWLCMYVRPVDMLWHGGQMPNWLPYRYSFLISFLLLSFGAEAFEKIRDVRSKAFGTAAVLLVGILLFFDYNEGHEYFDTELIILIPLAVLAVMLVLGYIAKRYGQHTMVKITLTAAVCLEMLLNTLSSLLAMHEDITFSDRSTYLGDIPYTRKITDKIHEYDDGFYRMEKTYHRCVNDPIALRMYGLSHSSSTLNAKAIKMLGTLGFSSREHYTRYDGATMLTDDIFGVKYVLSKYKCYVPYEDTVPIDNEIDVTVYENKDAFDIAYLADGGISGWNTAQAASPFDMQNKLAGMLSGNKASVIFRPAGKITSDSENVTSGTTTDAHYSYRKKNENAKAWVSFSVMAPVDGPYYMYFPTDYERETYLYVNDSYLSNYFRYENYSIEYLGTFSAGETFTVKLELLEDAVYFKTMQFYYIDMEMLDYFDSTMEELNKDTEFRRESQTRLVIDVNAEKDCALFTTIPLEEGWTAYIDGKEVGLSSALDESLMCMDVPQGEHEIVLEFFPAGLKAGIILAAAGVSLLAVLLLFNVRKRKTAELRKIMENDADSFSDSASENTVPYQANPAEGYGAQDDESG